MRIAPCLVALALVLAAPPAAAVRPFITDDARVVGGRTLQLETWVRADREAFQHWVLVGFGPVGPVELTLGGRLFGEVSLAIVDGKGRAIQHITHVQ